MKSQRTKKKQILSRTKVTIIIAVVLMVAVAAILTNHAKSISKTASATPMPTPQAHGPETLSTPTPKPSDPTPATTPDNNPDHPVSSTLAKPTGDVLNKTNISLSSSKIETSPAMRTSCNTIVGAYCGLQLTGPAGQTKQVNPSATDSTGGNSFDWDAKSAGLTPGNWSVQLLATANGRTSLGDTYNLKVNQ